jgi:hypothetical protein
VLVAVIPDAAQPTRPPTEARWRLATGVEVHSRRWAGETALYFSGAGETMVVSELGATAVEGILAGCSDLSALDEWCRDHGFAVRNDDLLDDLLDLLERLADYEIIEPA